MSIIKITGPKGSGKSLIAEALRNSQVPAKKGALLIDEQTDTNGNLEIHLEKIIIAAKFDKAKWKDLPWKRDSMIILVGNKTSLLDEFEVMMPGFKEFFGPVSTIQMSTEKNGDQNT